MKDQCCDHKVTMGHQSGTATKGSKQDSRWLPRTCLALLQDLHAAVASPAQQGITFKRCRHLSPAGHGEGGGCMKSWAWARALGGHADSATPPRKEALRAEGHRWPQNKTPMNCLRGNWLLKRVSGVLLSVMRRTMFSGSRTNTCAHGGAWEEERKAAWGGAGLVLSNLWKGLYPTVAYVRSIFFP